MSVFILRGLVREKAHWGDFPKKLQEKLGMEVITPEIEGVGEFYEIISPSNFDEMVNFMREKFYLPKKDNGPHYIISMSLGGMMAKRWIELYPSDFKAGIFINTSFKGITPFFERLKPNAIFKFIRIFLTTGIEERERKIISLVSNRKENYEEVLKSWVAIQKEHPVKRQSFINQIRAALSFNPSKERPQTSLLWLTSKGDRLCSYKSTEKLQALWGGEIHIHQDAGHDIPLDDSEWLVNKITDFIKRDK